MFILTRPNVIDLKALTLVNVLFKIFWKNLIILILIFVFFCLSRRNVQPTAANHGGSSMYPRGNSRSATATPTGSPKRRLPQIPGQGLPASAPTTASRMGGGRLRGGFEGGASMGGMTYHASYDGGLNNGAQMHPRGQSLHPSTRSRSMGHYGGYR